MVTSPYEWKILQWDEKPQANKQNRKTKSILVEIDWVVNIFLLFRFHFAFEKNIIIHSKKIEFSLTKNVLL